ncbi:unnamed protein product [Fructobacillus tropaeoli]|uniref:hypothetical protein n=1 Tax=Fructobacillus tropaeoli TaxID=709323 RepID=UPI002DAE88E9|nr:unnamed protein product [Fructobacillus tropaeoli]
MNIWYKGDPERIKEISKRLPEDEQKVFDELSEILQSSNLKPYKKNRVLVMLDKILYYDSIGLNDSN